MSNQRPATSTSLGWVGALPPRPDWIPSNVEKNENSAANGSSISEPSRLLHETQQKLRDDFRPPSAERIACSSEPFPGLKAAVLQYTHSSIGCSPSRLRRVASETLLTHGELVG